VGTADGNDSELWADIIGGLKKDDQDAQANGSAKSTLPDGAPSFLASHVDGVFYRLSRKAGERATSRV
jgi:hypothetical protein